MTFLPDRSVAFVDVVYRVIEGTAAIDGARALLQKIERRHGVFLRPYDDARPYMGDSDAWCERHLYPFLDDTHLTLAGGDFCNDIDVCDRDGAQLGATWRTWGGIVADWANARGWPSGPRRRRAWEYIDFYMEPYAGTELERYRDFVRVVRAAIGVE